LPKHGTTRIPLQKKQDPFQGVKILILGFEINAGRQTVPFTGRINLTLQNYSLLIVNY
jgi:hypothetical protein